VTAYQLTPVGPDGPQRERSQVIDVRSYEELLAENARLRAERATARADADNWHNAWATAVNNRIATQERLSRAMRVLASLGRLSPRMAEVVAAARREVYGDLP
jgi:hypothetical protein